MGPRSIRSTRSSQRHRRTWEALARIVYHIRQALTLLGWLAYNAINKAGGAMRYTRGSHRLILITYIWALAQGVSS